MRVSLEGAWAKLERGKHHADVLRAEIEDAGAPNPNVIPLRRAYEPNEGAVIYRIDRVMEVCDHWPLLAGDAIQNFRAALDHLMWQLAILHLGRRPTKKEAPNIQFPVITHARKLVPGGHRYLTHIRPGDIQVLKPFQPYKRLKRGRLHPLPKLVALSNTDKHRRLHLLVVAAHQAAFANRHDAYRGCLPVLQTTPDGTETAVWHHSAPRRPPRAGDEILRIPVHPTGHSPDVDVDAVLMGWVAIGRLGPVIPLLDACGRYVTDVLTAFQHIVG